MGVSLPSAKFDEIQQLALALFYAQPFCQDVSSLGKAYFCASGHSLLQQWCCVIQSDMLNVSHSPVHLFSFFHFLDSVLCQLQRLSHLQQSQVPFQLSLPDVVIATDVTPTHWTFCFRSPGLALFMSGSWLGSMCRVHIAIQEFQAVVLMLCRLAFQFSNKVVTLELDILLWKLFCVKKWYSISTSYQTCLPHIESGWQASYYFYCSIHSYPFQCGSQLSFIGSKSSTFFLI